MKNFTYLLFFVFAIAFSQKDDNQSTVVTNLMDGANSIVLHQKIDITISAYNEMQIDELKEVLVLNEKGLSGVGAVEFYNDNTKVKNIEAIAYDTNGEKLEKLKKRDFKDVSAVSSGTMYSDDRVLYLDYEPKDFPIKIVYTSEIETSNTAFIRPFVPVSSYNQAVLKKSFKIVNESDAALRFHKNTHAKEKVKDSIYGNTYLFSIQNLEAVQKESYSPSLSTFTPKIMFALSKFELEGVKGEASNWESFGKWQNENLLNNVNQLPESTIIAVQNLVSDLETVEEKAKAIYQYVQDNTRYISLQIGIGGWKPSPAEEVDISKYGDCKGLTNYTKSLLQVAGIESNYCVVQSGREISDLEKDFASMQGNHVILNIPVENQEDIWLECTSQKMPFNFLGSFTDNRNVLAVGNKGGKILKTPAYIENDNFQGIQAIIDIENEMLKAEVMIETQGTQYQSHFFLADADPSRVERYYSSIWSHLKRLNINDYSFINNKEDVIFSESLNVDVQNYFKKYGNDLVFNAIPFNRLSFGIKEDGERKNPFVVSRGFVDNDVYQFNMDELQLNALPENIVIKNKFGEYSLQFELNNAVFIVRRNLQLNHNEYEKTDFSDFVNFINQIENYENTKISFHY